MTDLVRGEHFEITPFSRDLDEDFVVSNWRMGTRRSSHELLSAAGKDRVAIDVAHVAGYRDEVFAFVVRARHAPVPALVWCYVRPAQRGRGVARALLSAAGMSLDAPMLVLLWSEDADAIARTHPAVFVNPIRKER